MTDGPSSEGPPPETEAAIFEAVRGALAEYGHADLSMAKIADRFEGSQSLLHYHYDTREGLLAAYLAHERERLAGALADLPEEPGPRLAAVVDVLLSTDEGATTAAYVELYALAPRSDAVRAELRETLALVRETVREAVADAVEAGVIDDRDPDATATMLLGANSAANVESLLEVEWDARGAAESVVFGGEFPGDPASEAGSDPGQGEGSDG